MQQTKGNKEHVDALLFQRGASTGTQIVEGARQSLVAQG